MGDRNVDARTGAAGDARTGAAGDARTGAADRATIHAEHQEYLEEAQRLIDEQTAALFSAAQEAATARWGDRQVDVRRAERSLTLRSGAHTAEITVEAITDLPEEADKAAAFTAGQARCIVRVDGAHTAEWVLRRIDVGSARPSYAWTHAESQAPVTRDEIIAVLPR